MKGFCRRFLQKEKPKAVMCLPKTFAEGCAEGLAMHLAPKNPFFLWMVLRKGIEEGKPKGTIELQKLFAKDYAEGW